MKIDKDSIRAISQIADERGIEMSMILSGLEAALLSAYKKKYQSGNQNIEVKIDAENGEIIINELRTIVEDFEHKKNPDTELTVHEALQEGFSHVSPGDVVKIERNPQNFGRIAAQTARQVITQRLRDAERLTVFSAFEDKVGDMITGTVFKSDGDQILVRLNERTDAFLPRKEKIPGEKYIPGTSMKFYVLDVKQMTRGPRITLSRTHPGLLRKLMELEIPEIQQGLIEIKNIARDGGARAKVALTSLDLNIDPIGTCIGNGGRRIKAVSGALRNEKIDILVWSSDPAEYIRNSLLPAQINKIEINKSEELSATAYVYPDQLSLAIGKSGQNVRLAAKLTGWKIDIKTIEPDRMPTLKDIFNEAMEDESENDTEISEPETKIKVKAKKERPVSKTKAIKDAFIDEIENENLDNFDSDSSVNEVNEVNEIEENQENQPEITTDIFDNTSDLETQNKSDEPNISDLFN